MEKLCVYQKSTMRGKSLYLNVWKKVGRYAEITFIKFFLYQLCGAVVLRLQAGARGEGATVFY